MTGSDMFEHNSDSVRFHQNSLDSNRGRPNLAAERPVRRLHESLSNE